MNLNRQMQLAGELRRTQCRSATLAVRSGPDYRLLFCSRKLGLPQRATIDFALLSRSRRSAKPSRADRLNRHEARLWRPVSRIRR